MRDEERRVERLGGRLDQELVRAGSRHQITLLLAAAHDGHARRIEESLEVNGEKRDRTVPNRLALASLCGHNLVTIRPPHPGAALIYPNLQSENT